MGSGATPISADDVLAWVDDFMGQMQHNEDLRLAQKVALLRSFDALASESDNKVTREALMQFLTEQEQAVRPQEVDAMLNEFGTNDRLSRSDLRQIIGRRGAEKKATSRR